MLKNALLYPAVLLSLPWVSFWAWRQERRILKTGRALTPVEMARASRTGVRHPDRIRVLVVGRVPLPGAAWMHWLAARLGFDGNGTAGMALRYGIFIRRDGDGDPALLVHECCHTAQYERAGSLGGFLKVYLLQCLRDGYFDSALEQEARAAADREFAGGGLE